MSLFDSTACQHLATTLAHFLWQGTVIGLLAVLVVAMISHRAARARYGVYLAAMLLMAACLPTTFALVASTNHQVAKGTDLTHRVPEIDTLESPLSPSAPSKIESEVGFSESPTARDENAEVPVAPTSVESTSTIVPDRPWTLYVVITYFCGMTIMLLRVTSSLYGGHRLRRDSTVVDDNDILELVRQVASQIGLKHVPTIAFCQRVSGPVVIGILRPIVLMPASLATGLSLSQIETILTHELAHLRRYDHLVLMLQRLIEAALFFHPAVWYVSRRMSVERENCCDDTVISAGTPRLAYAELLLKLAEQRLASQPTSMALAATGKPSRLRGRITRLLSPPTEPRVRLGRAWTFGTFAVLLAVAIPPVLSFARAQTPQPETPVAVEEEEGLQKANRDSKRLERYLAWGQAAARDYKGVQSDEAITQTFIPPFLGLLELARQNGNSGEPQPQSQRFAKDVAFALADDEQMRTVFARYFQRLPNLPFLKQAHQSQPEREAWIPAGVKSYDSFEVPLGQLFTDMIKPTGLFHKSEYGELIDDILYGFHHDPLGPRLDIEKDFFKHLGNRLTVIRRSNPQRKRQGDMLIAMKLKNVKKVTTNFAKIMAASEADVVNYRGHHVWQFQDAGKLDVAVGIAHGYLLIAHEMNLLGSVLPPKQPATKPPQQIAKLTRVKKEPPIVWGPVVDNFVVGIGNVKTLVKSPIRPVIHAYLENRGKSAISGVIQSSARFVLELDGKYYIQADYGGPSGIIQAGKRIGPIVINTDYFNEAKSLVGNTIDQTTPRPELKDGEHTIRLHFKIDSVFGGENVEDVIAGGVVKFKSTLAPYPTKEAIALLDKELQDKNRDVRRDAALAAGKLQLLGSCDALMRALKDEDKIVRRYSAEALGKIGNPKAIVMLRSLVDGGVLKEKEIGVRFAAVESLVKLGVPLRSEWIEPIIKSKHRIFQNAIWLVRRHAGKQAVPTLVRCLDEKNPSVNNYYNYTLVWQIHACGGPSLKYHHDFDANGTPEQIEHNREVLAKLKALDK